MIGRDLALERVELGLLESDPCEGSFGGCRGEGA